MKVLTPTNGFAVMAARKGIQRVPSSKVGQPPSGRAITPGQSGYWGLELARWLVENTRLPICILNGAVGGTRIDQQPAEPETA